MRFLRPPAKRSVSARAQLGDYHDSLKGAVNPGGSGTAHHTTFQLRVTPEDGKPEFMSRMSVWGGDADRLQSGRWTYVIYDADKPDRCELDKDRLAKEFEPLFNGKHRVMVPKEVSGDWLKNAATVSATPDPPEPASEPVGLVAELSRLAELRSAGALSDAEFAESKARLLAQHQPD
jgi:Short C-terminal domain